MKQDLANRILTAAVNRLGEPVTYSRGSSDTDINGIFSETVSSVDVDTGLAVVSEQPSLLIKASDLSITPEAGDRVTVAGDREFIVRETRSDGEGGLSLLLYKATSKNYM